MAAKAIERRKINIMDQIASKTLIPSTHRGGIPLINPSFHKFRDEDPSTFIGQKIPLYLTSKERAELAQKRYKELYLSSNELFCAPKNFIALIVNFKK